MNIKNETLTLRAIEKSDLPKLHEWSNDPDVQSLLGGWHSPSSMIVMERWFENITIDKNNIRFAIEHIEMGLIGTCGITDINWKDRNAFHGMLIGVKNLQGKGIGKQVVNLIMKYAFDELGLERLDGSIIEYNIPSIKLYTQKCGWQIEGNKKNWYYREGRFWDKILVGITKDEYRNIKTNE